MVVFHRNVGLRSLAGMLLCAASGLLGTLPTATGQEETPRNPAFSDQDLEFFEKQVRPILVQRCSECHGRDSEEPGGGLILGSHTALVEGGDSGAAVVPGNPDESLLIEAIRYEGLYEMPPKSKLPDQEIEILTRWVQQGAAWPPEDEEGWEREDRFDLEARKAEHWSWQPLQKPDLPPVGDAAWPTTEADRFILHRLESENLTPSPPADKATLIRRVYFDLTGLPPSPQQVEEFLSDDSPEAWEKVVDSLLESPRFGEHWGRHWLDLMRYAESRGHEFDYDIPNAYQYRDYVIRAFNQDVPYDQLVIEHLAGDLLPEPRVHPDEGFNESALGTGFWHLGEWIHSPVDIRKDETDRLDNMVDVMCKTFLGLTVSCARCHDHKFDAISQADYYAQFGFLKSSTYRQFRFDTDAHNREIAAKLEQLDAEAGQALDQALAETAETVQADLTEVFKAIAQAGSDEELAQIAAEKDLDPERLARWRQLLVQAAKDHNHPLDMAAEMLLTSPEQSQDESLREKAFRVIEESAARTADRAASVEDDVPHQVVIDFADLAAHDWRTNGPSFGLGPKALGDWSLALGDPEGGHRLRRWTAAVWDSRWKDLGLAEHTADENTKINGWQPAGRTLRTPNFKLQEGMLHYRVQGAGRVLAVVDSHRMLHGPLHGRVTAQFDFSEGKGPAWFTHDLRDYAGHTVHIEFVPLEDKPLEVLQVVEGLRHPAVKFSPSTSDLLAKHLAGKDIAEVLDSDDAVLRLWAELLPRSLADPEHRRLGAELSDWVWEHRELVWGEALPDVNAVLQPYEKRQAKLLAEVRWKSRTAPAMWDGSAMNEDLLIRGNTRNVGPEVPRGMLTAIGPDDSYEGPGSGRLEFAQQMTSRENPFISRVMVNRIWHHLLGQGIVPSVDNFGVLGQEPSHPQLLDHLAIRFMDQGWSIKGMIREIVLSQTYRQSSAHGGPGEETDPNNRLVRRANVRRLSGEQIRDSLLQVSGRLDPTMYGPGVPVHLTPFMQGRGRPGSGPVDGNGRRSIYLTIRRNFLSPMMLAFDMPQPFSTVGQRNQSNVPAQSLILMNDPFVLEQCDRWAEQLVRQAGLSEEARIQSMYRTLFAREPSDEERSMAAQFLRSHAEVLGVPPDRIETEPLVWRELAHVLVNTKEFVFVR